MANRTMPNCQPPPECTGLDVVFHISLPNIESLLVEIGSTSWNVEDGHKDYEMECNLLNIEYSGRYIYIIIKCFACLIHCII